MNATIHPTACTTPGCTNPPTRPLPYYVPGDEHDHACTTSHAANLQAHAPYLQPLPARHDDCPVGAAAPFSSVAQKATGPCRRGWLGSRCASFGRVALVVGGLHCVPAPLQRQGRCASLRDGQAHP